MPTSFRATIQPLMQTEDAVPQPEHEEWSDMIARISQPDRVVEVTEETYYYFLEVLPPRFMEHFVFGFAEGDEVLKIFWEKGSKFYCRTLTEEQHRQAGGKSYL